jgi:hypothetical protein
MRWATRAGVHIGRAACAWLIRRHIDPDARFVFVPDGQAAPADATAFDMPGVELSHHGDAVLRGLSMTGDDNHVLAVSGSMFDGLHEYLRRRILLGREPA